MRLAENLEINVYIKKLILALVCEFFHTIFWTPLWADKVDRIDCIFIYQNLFGNTAPNVTTFLYITRFYIFGFWKRSSWRNIEENLFIFIVCTHAAINIILLILSHCNVLNTLSKIFRGTVCLPWTKLCIIWVIRNVDWVERYDHTFI